MLESYEKYYDPIKYLAKKLKKVRFSLLYDDWALNCLANIDKAWSSHSI